MCACSRGGGVGRRVPPSSAYSSITPPNLYVAPCVPQDVSLTPFANPCLACCCHPHDRHAVLRRRLRPSCSTALSSCFSSVPFRTPSLTLLTVHLCASFEPYLKPIRRPTPKLRDHPLSTAFTQDPIHHPHAPSTDGLPNSCSESRLPESDSDLRCSCPCNNSVVRLMSVQIREQLPDEFPQKQVREEEMRESAKA